MALRPKEDQAIIFRQTGDKESRIGVVKRILKPEFNRHLKRVQYEVVCDGEKIYLDPNEIEGYVK